MSSCVADDALPVVDISGETARQVVIAEGTKDRGQYMAWVGTFDDLRNGRNGQCRIHLLHHHGLKGAWPGNEWDTGYSGVELLPGGTIVCTTYSRHFDDERQSSVVCTRFRIEEIDARLQGAKLK